MWPARIIYESDWVLRRWAEQQWSNQALASAANWRGAVELIPPPLSLPQGPAGFCTTDYDLLFAGAKPLNPPTQVRGRLKL